MNVGDALPFRTSLIYFNDICLTQTNGTLHGKHIFNFLKVLPSTLHLEKCQTDVAHTEHFINY